MNKGFNEKNGGITLIALVITIVVLLILAGVSLNAVIGNSGIINRTQEASKETDIAETREQILMELMGIYAGSGDYTNDDVITAVKTVTGEKVEEGTETITTAKGNEVDISDLWVIELAIGDYVNYTYDTAGNYVLTSDTCGSSSNSTDGIPQTTGLKWRILNIDESTGKIDLISDAPTSTTVYFSGSLGYNNGVYLINDICAEQYSNRSLGVTARNLTIEDIENGMNEAGLAARDADTEVVQYGTTKTYIGSYSYYPNLYAQEKGAGINTATVRTDGIGLSEYYTTPTTETYSQASTSSGLTVTQTYYGFSSTPSTYFDDSNFYSMIFGTGTYYWLASRCAYCDSGYAWFGLRSVNNAGLSGYDVWRSTRLAHNYDNRLRPVVSLDSNLLDGTKDADGVWQIRAN